MIASFQRLCFAWGFLKKTTSNSIFSENSSNYVGSIQILCELMDLLRWKHWANQLDNSNWPSTSIFSNAVFRYILHFSISSSISRAIWFWAFFPGFRPNYRDGRQTFLMTMHTRKGIHVGRAYWWHFNQIKHILIMRPWIIYSPLSITSNIHFKREPQNVYLFITEHSITLNSIVNSHWPVSSDSWWSSPLWYT